MMKKVSISLVLVFVLLFALLPVGKLDVGAETAEITSLSLTIASPGPGRRSTETPPEVTLGDGPFTLLAVNWLEDLHGYSSQTPDFTFRYSETYYAYVLLQAAEGYAFRKGKTVYGGVDEGYAAFDGCAVTGGTLEFAASKTYETGDFLRLKISVRSLPTGIGEVFFSVTPPVAGTSAEKTDAGQNVALDEGQHCTLEKAGWYRVGSDDLYSPFTESFVAGETYYLALDFAADMGYMFNQGGPIGYTAVRVRGGEPRIEFLSVTNMVDENGNPFSSGTVMIAVNAVENAREKPDPLFGDVDDNGKVTAADARLALRRAVDLETYAETTVAFLVSDVDFNGAVTAADARMILRAAVSLEDPADWLAEYKNRTNP